MCKRGFTRWSSLFHSNGLACSGKEHALLSFAETEPQNIGVLGKSVLLWDRSSNRRLEDDHSQGLEERLLLY